MNKLRVSSLEGCPLNSRVVLYTQDMFGLHAVSPLQWMSIFQGYPQGGVPLYFHIFTYTLKILDSHPKVILLYEVAITHIITHSKPSNMISYKHAKILTYRNGSATYTVKNSLKICTHQFRLTNRWVQNKPLIKLHTYTM